MSVPPRHSNQKFDALLGVCLFSDVGAVSSLSHQYEEADQESPNRMCQRMPFWRWKTRRRGWPAATWTCRVETTGCLSVKQWPGATANWFTERALASCLQTAHQTRRHTGDISKGTFATCRGMKLEFRSDVRVFCCILSKLVMQFCRSTVCAASFSNTIT